MTLDLSVIQRVRPWVERRIRRTPVVETAAVGGRRQFWKLESQQVTGSFKVRGPLAFRSQQHSGGAWVTASAGNHGLGVAYAAPAASPPHVFVSNESPLVKRRAIEQLGATLHLCEAQGYDATEEVARRWAAHNNGCFISPFDDDIIIAGNGGTLGCEILEQLPQVDCIVVPIGGGGLASGIGCAVRSLRPSTRLIGVQSVRTNAMAESLQRGTAVLRHRGGPTLAEGLEGGVSTRTFHYVQRWFDDVVTVEESAIRSAIAWLWKTLHIRVEGSAAVVAAALLDEGFDASNPAGGSATDRRIYCGVLTGSNIDTDVFDAIVGAPEV